MNEQIDICSYLSNMNEEIQENGYLKYLVKGFKVKCDYWKYDWFEQIKSKPKVETVYKTICKITKNHFFNLKGTWYEKDVDLYGARFIKNENVIEIYKCGKEHKKILETIDIQKLVDEIERYVD